MYRMKYNYNLLSVEIKINIHEFIYGNPRINKNILIHQFKMRKLLQNYREVVPLSYNGNLGMVSPVFVCSARDPTVIDDTYFTRCIRCRYVSKFVTRWWDGNYKYRLSDKMKVLIKMYGDRELWHAKKQSLLFPFYVRWLCVVVIWIIRKYFIIMYIINDKYR